MHARVRCDRSGQVRSDLVWDMWDWGEMGGEGGKGEGGRGGRWGGKGGKGKEYVLFDFLGGGGELRFYIGFYIGGRGFIVLF